MNTPENGNARTRRWCCYASGVTLLFCIFTLSACAQKPPEVTQPTVLSVQQAAKEGRQLANEMLSQRPAENKTTTGVMTIRRDKKFAQIPIEFSVQITPTNWMSTYKGLITNFVMQVAVLHTAGHPNIYFQNSYALGSNGAPTTPPAPGQIKGDGIMAPFAASDFSIEDLGLEFLHWPVQRLVQKEMKRSRSCRVLESINPRQVPGSYTRVKSWVDVESDGIVYALAYDFNGKELKEFIPKDFSKVNGQWQLEQMQISNLQTDSSTTVKFNLGH